MKTIKCPKCNSEKIQTERRINGYHMCMMCCHKWKNNDNPTVEVLDDVLSDIKSVIERVEKEVKALEDLKRQEIEIISDYRFVNINTAISNLSFKLYHEEDDKKIEEIKEIISELCKTQEDACVYDVKKNNYYTYVNFMRKFKAR